VPPVTDSRLPGRLLAGRDRLGVIEKDEILAAVLPAAEPRRRAWWIGVGALAAAAVIVMVMWKQPAGDLTPRGGATNATYRIAANGHTLMFDLAGTSGYRYFAAFAKASDGTVIWFFPESIDTQGHLDHGVIDRGATIDAAGHYTTYGVFSTVPLTRDDLHRRFDADHLTAGDSTVVITRELVVP
jgi:hypothetical protein